MDPKEAVGVFEGHRREVYGWAYRLLGRHHDAQDTAQEVFLRWLAQSRRAVPENPRGWLRQVTVNRAIDQLRLRRTTVPPTEAVMPHSTASECDELEKRELRSEVAAALAQLTEAQRSVLVAKVYDGLTFAEIAIELGVAVPTAKTHYLRALSAVRDSLARHWAPERSKP
ncbi:MAG: RNA polymerase sigma factor [Planctomycetota bacterium]